ncbi:unnamed protein product, partial [Phaeothamnion confervicola]
MRLAGETWLGPSWALKPFFGGTALAQLFASADLAGPREGGAAANGSRSGGNSRDDDGADVSFSGADLWLCARARLAGRMALQPATAAVHVAGNASLVTVADAAIVQRAERRYNRGQGSQRGGDESGGDRRDTAAVLWNAGTLEVSEGVHLSVSGGLVQIASGRMRLPLPPPLVRDGAETEPSGRAPLTVEWGTTQLAGVMNVFEPQSFNGGGDGGGGGVRLHERWAMATSGAGGRTAAADVNVNGLAPLGPAGVKMDMKLHPREILAMTGCGGSTGNDRAAAACSAGAVAGWALVFEAVFIECAFMLHYGNVSTAGGPCQACLANTECAWCVRDMQGEGGGGLISGSGGDDGSCEPRSVRHMHGDGRCQSGGCCPQGCRGVGTCDSVTGRCRCRWFYTGGACSDISASGAAVLAGVAAVLVLAAAALLQTRYLRPRQRRATVRGTLQELRQGLLDAKPPAASDGDLAMGPAAAAAAAAAAGWKRLGSGRGGTVARRRGGGCKNFPYCRFSSLCRRDVLVPFGEISLGPNVGGGAVGAVFRASWRGAAVAVKMVRLPFHADAATAEAELERLKREAYLMSRLRHPNIVMMLAISFAQTPLLSGVAVVGGSAGYGAAGGSGGRGRALCIITEFMARGSLEDVITRGELDGAPYALLLRMALQAARGMLYLHTHAPPICHRDLKSSNLVVGLDWTVKITDFGMSRFVRAAVSAPATPAAVTAASAATAG